MTTATGPRAVELQRIAAADREAFTEACIILHGIPGAHATFDIAANEWVIILDIDAMSV